MPNPAGVNSFDRFAQEPAYGQVTREADLAQAAPIAGAGVSAPARNAPRRSQRRAVRSGGQSGQVPEAVSAAPPPEPSYEAKLASVWNEVAATPGASPLVQEYAVRAQPQ